MSFQETSDSFQSEVERRIATLKTIGSSEPGTGRLSEWYGFFVSKQGDGVKYMGTKIPAGEWLYFSFHFETLPDQRIIFSDASCFWLNIPTPFFQKGGCYYPMPPEIKAFIVRDGDYTEWKDAFKAIEDHFPKDNDLKNMWAWRTDQVKQFMLGEYPDWVSNS